jgi:hypothetical protein
MGDQLLGTTHALAFSPAASKNRSDLFVILILQSWRSLEW